MIWNTNKQRINNTQILNENHFIYHLNTIQNIQLLVPYYYNQQQAINNTLSLYIKPKNVKHFILFKQFNVTNDKTEKECDYFCKILSNLNINNSHFNEYLFDKINIKWNEKWITNINYYIITKIKNKKTQKIILNLLITLFKMHSDLFYHLLNILELKFITFNPIFNFI